MLSCFRQRTMTFVAETGKLRVERKTLCLLCRNRKRWGTAVTNFNVTVITLEIGNITINVRIKPTVMTFQGVYSCFIPLQVFMSYGQNVCLFVCMCACVRARACVCVCVFVFMLVCVCVGVCVCVCVSIFLEYYFCIGYVTDSINIYANKPS